MNAPVLEMRRCTAVAASLAALAVGCQMDFERFAAHEPGPLPAVGAGGGAPTDPSVAGAAPASPSPEPPVGDAGANDASTGTSGGPITPTNFCDEPGLVGRWKFDENAGSVANDCTSGQTTGIVAGNTSRTTGHSGKALELSGGTVTFGKSPRVSLTGALTVSAWVKVSAFSASHVIGKSQNDLSIAGGWRMSVFTGGGVSFGVARGPGVSPCEPATRVLYPPGTWLHLAGVFVPGVSVTLYVDGKAAASCLESPPATLVDAPVDLRIGIAEDAYVAPPFYGTIDDVRLYDRALSPTEIAQLVP